MSRGSVAKMTSARPPLREPRAAGRARLSAGGRWRPRAAGDAGGLPDSVLRGSQARARGHRRRRLRGRRRGGVGGSRPLAAVRRRGQGRGTRLARRVGLHGEGAPAPEGGGEARRPAPASTAAATVRTAAGTAITTTKAALLTGSLLSSPTLTGGSLAPHSALGLRPAEAGLESAPPGRRLSHDVLRLLSSVAQATLNMIEYRRLTRRARAPARLVLNTPAERIHE